MLLCWCPTLLRFVRTRKKSPLVAHGKRVFTGPLAVRVDLYWVLDRNCFEFIFDFKKLSKNTRLYTIGISDCPQTIRIQLTVYRYSVFSALSVVLGTALTRNNQVDIWYLSTSAFRFLNFYFFQFYRKLFSKAWMVFFAARGLK